MANIIFTNKCNIQCPFCFANENNANENDQRNDFTIANTWDITNFINNGEFRFCGGEPTQNPNIISAIELLLKSNKNIMIMTNGLWPPKFQTFVKELKPKYSTNIHYLFNVLPPEFYSKTRLKQLYKTLETINPTAATLGFTIYKKDFNYKYLFDVANTFSIKSIRWSIAAPYISSKKYDMDKYFYEISDIIYHFLKDAQEHKIVPQQDCGYIPPCFYDKEKLMDITFGLKTISNFKCINAPIDIDNKGNAWRCYGLFPVLRTNINKFKNENDLRGYFNRRTNILKNNLPLYKDCKECNFWLKSCTGGCYAIRIKKVLEKKAEVCLFPIDDDKEILNCIPVKQSNFIMKSNNNNEKMIFWKAGGVNKVLNNPDENTIAFLDVIDGEKTILDLIKLWQINFTSYDKVQKAVYEMSRKLFELDIIQIKYNYKIDLDFKPGQPTSKIESGPEFSNKNR